MFKWPAILLFFVAQSMFAQGQTTITGSLVGYDARPLHRAHVHLAEAGRGSFLTVDVDGRGNFTISTEKRGLLMLQFTGVDHAMYEVPVLIELPTKMEIAAQITTNRYVPEFGSVRVIGDFNNFAFSGGVEMERQSDGTYVAEFETEKDVFAYQLLGVVPNRSVNGTMSDDFEYDGGGDYRSIVKSRDGKVKIVFDPEKLVRTQIDASVRFKGKGSERRARLVDIYMGMTERRETFMRAISEHHNKGLPPDQFTYDWTTVVADVAGQIKREKDPMLRHALMVSYFELGMIGAKELDAAIATRALKEIPPTSPFWGWNSGTLMVMASRAADEKGAERYLESVIARHENASMKAELLFSMIMRARAMGQDEKAAGYFDMLVSEYPEHPITRYAKQSFSPDRAVVPGKPVPPYSVPALDDATIVYTHENMRGRVYLIDFWAVWCKPCIDEMDDLHEAYEKYKGKDFEILSLSFDNSPDDVRKFREKRWKMPWLHSFVEEHFESDLAKRFEVMGIPKPILVDETGMVIATDVDLRGENLEKTLAKVFGEKE